MLTSDFLPSIGGITAHVVGLSTGLARLGHEVTVVVPHGVPIWQRRSTHEGEDQGHPFRVMRLWVPSVPGMAGVQSRFKVRQLRRIMNGSCDVVHWHTFEQPIIRRLEGVGKVFTNHTSQFLEYAVDSKSLLIARSIVDAAELVIAPSHELGEATIAVGYPRERVRVIPNGVETSRFSPEVDGHSIRMKHGISRDECVVLCPRRLENKNGVIYWVRAIPHLLATTHTPLRFMFVGDYEYEDQYSARHEVLRALSELRLGERVIFTGAVPNGEMPGYFAASDIVVIPSLMEATSIAALEAMASAKPIVGTDVGGLPEIITDGVTGYLVLPADPRALAEKAGRLIGDIRLRETFGLAARARVVEHFDWREVARRTVNVYEQVLGTG